MLGMKRLRFSLRQLLIATALVALVALLLTQSWHRTRTRNDYLNHRGAIDGRAPTVKACAIETDRTTSISGLLFGDRYIGAIQLIPGTYDQPHLEYVRDLFPEAILTEEPLYDLKAIKQKL
jgi:hypothetical protein